MGETPFGVHAPDTAMVNAAVGDQKALMVERLVAAVEDECEGLAISDETARAILHFVLTGEAT